MTLSISEHYQDYLEYIEEQARDQLHHEPLQDISLSKEFLEKKEKAGIGRRDFSTLRSELLGAGPLEPLLQDQAVTEVIVNQYDQIYFEKAGRLSKYERQFSCLVSYQNFVERLCHEAGIVANNSKPHGDGVWRGFRVHLIGKPLVREGTQLCLRRNSLNSWSLDKLLEAGWCDQVQKESLIDLVQSKSNVLVIGPTNTGKTTCINACLSLVGEGERVLFIEDTDELARPNDASVKLLTRAESEVGIKSYGQQDLLHQSLRMRPDRIVVGEVRGGEAKDYLMALATGHRGCWCSLHAENPWQALHRLELLIQMSQPQWKSESVRQLIKLGLDAIICLENKNGKRKLNEIYKITSLEPTGFCLEKVSGDNYY